MIVSCCALGSSAQAQGRSLDAVQILPAAYREGVLKYASETGRKLGSVSYALQQKGAASAPLWSVWCYVPTGGYIGLVTLMATSGDIVSAE